MQSNLLESNPNFPQIWADKVDVLNYILSGYLARIDTLANVGDYQEELAETISRSEFIKKELLTYAKKIRQHYELSYRNRKLRGN